MGLFNLSLDCECCDVKIPVLITPQVYFHRNGSKSIQIAPSKDGAYFHYPTLAEQVNNLIPQITGQWNFVKDEMWANVVQPPASPTIPSGWAFGIGGIVVSGRRSFTSDIGVVFFSSPIDYLREQFTIVGTAGRHGHATLQITWVSPDYVLAINANLLSQVWGLVLPCSNQKTLLECTDIAKIRIEYQTSVYPNTVAPPWDVYVNKLALDVADPNAPAPLNAFNTFKSANTETLNMTQILIGYGSCSVIQSAGFNVVGVDGSMIDRIVDGDVTEETTLAPDTGNTSYVLELDNTSGFLNFPNNSGEPYLFLAFYSNPLYWDSNPIPGPPIIDFAFGQWLHGVNFVCVKKVTFFDADDDVIVMSNFNQAIFIPPGNSLIIGQ